MTSWMAIAVTFLLWSGPVVDGHLHKAANGGVIAHAGPYHLELVLADDAVQLWVLDGDERGVRLPADARLSLTVERRGSKLPPGYKVRPEPPARLERAASGDHFLGRSPASLRNPAKVLVRAELTVAGKTYSAALPCEPLDFKHRLYDGLEL